MNMPRFTSTQSRKHYAINRQRNAEMRARKFAKMRAAKEAKRVSGLATDPVLPDMSHCARPRHKASANNP